MKLNKNTFIFLRKVGVFIGILALLVACSRKKNKWVNRNFHAMGSYYNIIYNGQIALENGREQLDQNYVDDYWNILPIERIKEAGKPIKYGEAPDISTPKPQKKRTKKATEKKDKIKSRKSQARSISQRPATAFGGDDNSSPKRGGQNNNQSNINFPGNHGQNNNQSNMNPPGRGGQNNNQSNMNPPGRGGQNNNQSNMNPPGRGGQNNNQSNTNFPGSGGQNNNFGSGANSPSGFSNQGNSFASSSASRSNTSGGNPSNLTNNPDATGDEVADSQFDRAETKAAKAIQKHNMLIHGEEYNPQMDKAFLLLGKARYYDQRYFPALEAFNYVLTKYDDSDQLATAKIWLEKTYMRLESNERTVRNLTDLLNEDIEFSDEDLTEASATIAQAYLNMDEKEKAIAQLNTAIKHAKDNAKKGRYLFIKGQVFERLNKIDSAKTAFNQVIALNRKSPRIYMINAYMEKAKKFDFKTGNHAAQLDTLKTMLVDRENRPYLDIINYQTAQYYKATDSMPTAIVYYNKSLRTNTPNHGLKSRIYKILGNYNFDDAQYKTAGAYYDSTMVNLPEATREYRDIRRKRINLNDVIKYEDIAVRNDSILHLVNMPEVKRQTYFEKYADSLKTIAIAQAEKAKKDAKNAKRTTGDLFGRQQSQAGGGQQSAGGSFYFYNQNQVAFGEQAFKKIWGDRELEDNWRSEASKSSSKKDKEEEKEIDYMAQIESNPAFEAQTYIDQVPTDKKVIDSLSDTRNFAYYQLGVIYKEKFKEYKLATDKLEKLLDNDPEERLILPSKYNLYKIYEILGNTAKANKWKQDILTNHSDSRYAKILRNPSSLRDENSNPVKVYNGLYKSYKAENYQYVIDECEKDITRFIGDDIVPKMELLKATAKGRLYGFDAYKTALNYVALTYPQSEEGKKAEQIISETLPKMESTKFKKKAEGNYNLIYMFASSDREGAEKLQKTLDKAIVQFKYSDLSTSIDTYSPERIFLVVHGLKSKLGAEGFGEKLKKEKKYKIKHGNFGVSSANYKVLLIHKNLDAYLKEFGD